MHIVLRDCGDKILLIYASENNEITESMNYE